ncbi:hypothetical protein [Actinoplanes sp. RD1]|uniref:hypothetical protein n=1 Tax=Actinoplanes sp. RD1 TaxID=3064538 RepID=UPI0027414490|nr:hypothetical protein [Actinoplanes sp. RD1]
MSIANPRWALAGNALAGAWRVAAWAAAKDGTSFTDRHAAATMTFKRATRLSADAGPEPVKKGRTVTVTGSLTRQDWATWTAKPYAGRPVTLQFRKWKTSTWTTVKTGKSSASGVVKLTTPAKADGHFRLVYAADATSAGYTSVADYVDVR